MNKPPAYVARLVEFTVLEQAIGWCPREPCLWVYFALFDLDLTRKQTKFVTVLIFCALPVHAARLPYRRMVEFGLQMARAVLHMHDNG